MKTKIALGLAIAMIPVMAFANEGRNNDRDNSFKKYFTNASSSNATSTLNTVCINPVIDKRENALISGHDAMNTSIKAALTARGTSLKAAYALNTQNARKQARNASWDQFRISIQASHTAMKTVRTNAWNIFKVEMKACGVSQNDKPMNISLPSTAL
jgi:hypothetical protein